MKLTEATKQELISKFDSFARLLEASGALYNSWGNKWNPREYQTYGGKRELDSAYGMGAMSWEVAADHLFCFLDSAKEPVKPIGIFTCVRGALESAALAAWMLDPKIGPQDRVGRHFAFRYEGLTQQLKYANDAGDQQIAGNIRARVDKVEADALALGFALVQDKNQKRIGIAEYMPPISDLIETALGMRKRYRLLSAVAHGHHWAIQKIGFAVVSEETDGMIVTKHVPPDALLYLLTIAFESFAHVLVNGHTLFGYDLAALRKLLNDYSDETRYTGNRFWNPPT